MTFWSTSDNRKWTLIKYEHNETPTFGLASIKMYCYVDGEDEKYTKNTLKADVIIESRKSEISITYVIRRKGPTILL